MGFEEIENKKPISEEEQDEIDQQEGLEILKRMKQAKGEKMPDALQGQLDALEEKRGSIKDGSEDFQDTVKGINKLNEMKDPENNEGEEANRSVEKKQDTAEQKAEESQLAEDISRDEQDSAEKIEAIREELGLDTKADEGESFSQTEQAKKIGGNFNKSQAEIAMEKIDKLVEKNPKKEVASFGGMLGGEASDVDDYLENDKKMQQEINESGVLGGMSMAEKSTEESKKTGGNFNKSQGDIGMEKADNIIKEDNKLEMLERERANEEALALSEISIFCKGKMDEDNVENEFKKIIDSASKLKDGHPVKVALEKTSNVKLDDVKIKNLKEIGEFSSLYFGNALDSYEDEPFSKSNVNEEFNELSREEAEKEFMLLNEISKLCNGAKNNLNPEILSKKIGVNIDKLRANHPVRNFYERIMNPKFQGALSKNIEKLGKFSKTYSGLGLNIKE